MRIAHLIFSFQTGGAEVMLADIINRQVKRFPVALFIVNDEINHLLLSKLDASVSVFCINRPPRSKNPFHLLSVNFKLFSFRPTIIHCHNHNNINLLFFSLRRKAILTVHDTGINTVNFSKYQKLVAISEVVSADILKRSGIKATIVSNGINIEGISVRTDSLKRDDYRIVQVSRLFHEKKGQDIILKALSILRNKFGIMNVRLDFIGDGPSEFFLKQICQELGLTDRVRFLGSKDREYVYKHLCEYDMLIQPSNYEGFGLTVLEALAANVTVLVSDIEGPREVLNTLNTGYMFKAGDSVDCAAKIRSIMSHEGEYEQEIVNKIWKRYSIDNTADKYIEVYDTV